MNQNVETSYKQLPLFEIIKLNTGSPRDRDAKDDILDAQVNKSLDQWRGVYISLAHQAREAMRTPFSSIERSVTRDVTSILPSNDGGSGIRSTSMKIIPQLSADDIRGQIKEALEMNPGLLEDNKGAVTFAWTDWYSVEASSLVCRIVIRTHDEVMEKMINGIRDIPNI